MADRELYTAASAVIAAGGQTDDLNVADIDALILDVNATAVAGTTPALNIFLEEKRKDGIYYLIDTVPPITVAGVTRRDIGPGRPQNADFGDIVRLRWTITGTVGPTVTASINLVGERH